jgi:hypothetical protein
MVVRYTGGAPNASCLERGADYVVLAILSDPLTFKLHLPDERVTDWCLVEGRYFEIVDGAVPPNWALSMSEHAFYLEPATWSRRGHYDDLFGSDRPSVERAWSDHRVERDLILAHAGRPPGREGSIGHICRAHLTRPD